MYMFLDLISFAMAAVCFGHYVLIYVKYIKKSDNEEFYKYEYRQLTEGMLKPLEILLNIMVQLAHCVS